MFSDSPPYGISCWSKDGSLQHLEAQIIGSETSPYVDGIFKLHITVPERYPFEPPTLQFVTPIYHPNIDSAGRICLDSLKMPPKGSWSPALNICTLLTTIQLLMSEPNPDDPLMLDIANEFKYNRVKFEETARHWTDKHARSTAATHHATGTAGSGTGTTGTGSGTGTDTGTATGTASTSSGSAGSGGTANTGTGSAGNGSAVTGSAGLSSQTTALNVSQRHHPNVAITSTTSTHHHHHDDDDAASGDSERRAVLAGSKRSSTENYQPSAQHSGTAQSSTQLKRAKFS